jgi:hypothetical protein
MPVTGPCASRVRARAGVGRDAPEGPQPRSKGQSGTLAHRGRDARRGRGREVAPGREAARASRIVAVVARSRGNGAGSGPYLALVCAAFRSGAHLPLPQAEHGMDDAAGSPPRAGRPMDVGGCGRFRPTQVGAHVRCGPAAAVGAPLRCRAPYADPGPSRRFGAFGAPGHARQAAETLR